MAAAARPLRRDWIDNDEKRMTVDRRSDGIYAEITSIPIRSVVVASLSFSLKRMAAGVKGGRVQRSALTSVKQ
jgi:hypothetical protein